MTNSQKLSAAILTTFVPVFIANAASRLSVRAVNPLPFPRASQTIELPAAQLAPLDETDFKKIHVRDDSGQELICLAVDKNFDAYHKPDEVISLP